MAEVFQRMKGGKWCCRFMINGKRIVQALDFSKPEAQKMSDLLEAKMRAEAPALLPGARARGDMPFAAFETLVLQHYADKRKPGTYNIVKRAFVNLNAAFPIQRLDQITPDLVRGLREHWAKTGRVGKRNDGRIGGAGVIGAEREIRAIVTAMRWAEDEFKLPAQNWRPVRKEKWNEKGEVKLRYSKEEHKAICAAIQTPLEQTLYVLGYYLGLRRDEIRHLWREDVDFEAGLVYIRRKEWKGLTSGESMVWEPKGTHASSDMTRSVPLAPAARAFLGARLAAHKGKWIASDTLAEPFLADTLSDVFAAVVKRAKVPGSLHTLRHSYISDLLANGEDIYVVAQFAGHKNISTTMLYAHFRPKESKANGMLHVMPIKMSMAAAM